MGRKALSILGSTGSIGVRALDVVSQFPECFEVVGLAAGSNIDLLCHQIEIFRPRIVSVLNKELAIRLAERLAHYRPRIVYGVEGYKTIATLSEVDLVLSAIVGAAGLLPTLAAIEAGKNIALANKETLVIAGELVMKRASEREVQILPVDSEHSAIFQSLQGNRMSDVRRILLTASGGPFFRKSVKELETVTPEAALRHPNWSMGRKITIDSATLMNKGLEIIEARWLFNIPVDRISVHIHPESIIHSMVEYRDGSVIAQLGVPDMRIPIAYALSYPCRLPVKTKQLDLLQLGTLTFYPPDLEKFPCLRLAIEACRIGGTMPAVLNAANEVAVNAFLEGKIGFLLIPRVIEMVMEEHETRPVGDLDTLLETDKWARARAGEKMEALLE